MKNRKEKRRGEGLGSPGSSAQSAPARAAQLTAQQRLRAPHLRSLPLDPACQPHDAHAHTSPCLRLQPLPLDPASQPYYSSSPRRARPPCDRASTAMAGRARGSRPGHGLAPPLAQRPRQRHANHPRPASRSMRSARSLAVRRGA